MQGGAVVPAGDAAVQTTGHNVGVEDTVDANNKADVKGNINAGLGKEGQQSNNLINIIENALENKVANVNAKVKEESSSTS